MYTRKGYCRYSSKCRFQHIDAPVRPKSSSASAPGKTHQPLNKRHGNKDHVKKLGFGGRCHKCGKTGHKRKDCTGDNASVAVDLVASVHDVSNLHGSREDAREGDRGWLQHDFDGEAEDEDVAQDVRHVDFAFPVLPKSGHSLCAWMVDGGSTCHVLGAVDFDSKFIFNRRPASISITVGGGGRINCDEVGDLCLRIVSGTSARVCTFLDVRISPGFGSNLLSGPRMEKAGWSLTQKGGVYTATDARGDFIFSSQADLNGLYFLDDVHPIMCPSDGCSSPARPWNPVSSHRRPSLRDANDFSGGQDVGDRVPLTSRSDLQAPGAVDGRPGQLRRKHGASRESENHSFLTLVGREQSTPSRGHCGEHLATAMGSGSQAVLVQDFHPALCQRQEKGPVVPLQPFFSRQDVRQVSSIDLLQHFEKGGLNSFQNPPGLPLTDTETCD